MSSSNLVAIVPVLNEGRTLAALTSLLVNQHISVVVSDGGSTDNTVAIAHAAGAQVVSAPAGRASQLNAGAAMAMTNTDGITDPAHPQSALWLLFLHADVQVPASLSASVFTQALAQCEQAQTLWARFDVELLASQEISRGQRTMLRIIGSMMNWRSALTGICTGDQGLLVRSDLFNRVGGFDAIALMEDIAISKKLKRAGGMPLRLAGPLLVSARRWERNGVLQTMVAMWYLRLRYFLGADPQALHRVYYKRND